ncbi:MAG: hypothetical protein ACI8TQ_002293, partial [Planctomycetota bacterium]
MLEVLRVVRGRLVTNAIESNCDHRRPWVHSNVAQEANQALLFVGCRSRSNHNEGVRLRAAPVGNSLGIPD